jgi:hypothetical protein
MGSVNISYYLPLINDQIESQEQLSHYLTQIKSMFDIALEGDFLFFPKSTIHYYLLVIDDIAARAKNANEQMLADWSEIIKLIKQSQVPPTGQITH